MQGSEHWFGWSDYIYSNPRPEFFARTFKPYLPATRDIFGPSAIHGQIIKTYSVTDLRKDAAHRYSPAAVVAVSRQVVGGAPVEDISTSYVERQNLSLRMASRRFTRLTNGFSKRLDQHVAAVALYVAHYNLCRVPETLRTTPAVALGVTDRTWSIGPTTAPDRRRRFTVIEGGKS